MAKSVPLASIKYVNYPNASVYSDVGTIPELNVRKDLGDVIKLRNSLAAKGWDTQFSLLGEVINDDESKRVIELLKVQHEAYKANLATEDLKNVTIVDHTENKSISVKGLRYVQALLACFEYAFLDTKGNYKKPKILATTGNRRCSVRVDAMACQLLLHQEKCGDTKIQPKDCPEGVITTHISVKVPDTTSKRYPDTAVRKMAQIAENEMSDEGKKNLTELELLSGILDEIEVHGYSQSDIRNNIRNAAMGIRLYFLCVIDIFCRRKAADHGIKDKKERARWGAINLINRFLVDQFKTKEDEAASRQNPEWLDIKRFTQFSVQGREGGDKPIMPMGNMCETDYKFDRVNKERGSANPAKSPIVRPTVDMVEAWILQQITNSSGAQAIMSRDKINGHTQNPNPCVKEALNSVLKNNPDLLAKSTQIAPVCNYAYGVGDEVYQPFAQAVQLIGELDAATQAQLWGGFCLTVQDAVNAAEASETEVSLETEVSKESETAVQ